MRQISVYVHWPFCESKCPYCDFNSHVRDSIDHDSWLISYLLEIDYYQDILKNRKLKSIFFGGGTPSLAEPKVIGGIIEYITKISGSTSDDLEITLEANPSSSESKKFKEFKENGINRISLGIQSLNQSSLEFLGRKHNALNAKKSIEYAASTFDNYSFDLIYALPGYSCKEWEKELREALKYQAPHMSLYQLTIEKGTQFFSSFQKKEFTLPDEEESAQMYELTQNIMKEFKMDAYEVSNHAKESYECRHNIVYWEYDDYIGIGPGAHGRFFKNGAKTATMNIHSPEKWLKQVTKKGNGVQSYKEISEPEMFKERLMMGLRLKDGICLKNSPADQVFWDKSYELKDMDFLSIKNKRVSVTPKGFLVLNQIIKGLIKS